MDLPITPKFFKKLELFQELNRLDKRNIDHVEWKMERQLLLWAHSNHFHLGSYLSNRFVFDTLKKTEKFSEAQLNEHVVKTMENLCEHGWSERPMSRDQRAEIKINREGMLVAEVLSDVSRGRKTWYQFLIIVSWLTIVAGIIIVLVNAFDVIRGLLK
jgi:hypothetical protein